MASRRKTIPRGGEQKDSEDCQRKGEVLNLRLPDNGNSDLFGWSNKKIWRMKDKKIEQNMKMPRAGGEWKIEESYVMDRHCLEKI